MDVRTDRHRHIDEALKSTSASRIFGNRLIDRQAVNKYKLGDG